LSNLTFIATDRHDNHVGPYFSTAPKNGIIYYNVWLERFKQYNPKGRFQTEEQAKEIDRLMKPYLENLGVQFYTMPARKEDVYAFCKEKLQNHPEALIENIIKADSIP
jgi:hypothetical protein